MLVTCILVELAVLVALAWMERLPQFLVNVSAGLLALCFLVFYQGDKSIGTNLGVCAFMGFFACMGASILWRGVRFLCLAIEDPREAIEAIDTVAMERAVAKSLSRGADDPNSYGNRRASQEIVRRLKERNDGE